MFKGGSFMRRKKRFRKDSDEFENNSPTPDSDVSILPSHDVNMTSYSDVRESTSQMKERSSLLPVLFSTNDTAKAPCWFLAEGLSEKHLVIDRLQMVPYNKGPGIVFSAFPSSSICLVCAVCTCCY